MNLFEWTSIKEKIFTGCMAIAIIAGVLGKLFKYQLKAS